MRLVACPSCHLQYDVTRSTQAAFQCSCGENVQVVVHGAVDAPIHRCGSCGASLTAGAEVCEYCESAIVRDVSKLSLICPECYSRCADGSRYCTNCGLEFKPLAIPGESEALGCPACENEMRVRPIGTLPVHECGHCNGLWVPEEQFDQIVQKATEAQRDLPSNGLALASRAKTIPIESRIEYRKCPVCKGPMHRKNFGRRSGVIVDWCGEHGTWLDADELEHIAKFILSGGLKRTSPVIQYTETGGGARKRTPAQMEALLMAEKRLAEERLKQANQRARFEPQGLRIGSLGDLLDFFLG